MPLVFINTTYILYSIYSKNISRSEQFTLKYGFENGYSM